MLSGVALASSLAAALAHRLPIRTQRGASWLLFVASSLLVVSARAPGWWAAIAMVAYFSCCAAGEVHLDAQLQRSIRGRGRSTIASLKGLAQECFGIVLYLVVGGVAGARGWPAALLVLAAVQGLFSLAGALRNPVDHG